MSRDDRFVIFELPAGSEVPCRRFAVSRLRFRRGAWVVGGALLTALLVLAVVVTTNARRNARLGRTNLALVQKLEGLDQRVAQAEDALLRVQSYDAKIRALTHADEGVRPFGIGPLDQLDPRLAQREEATLPLAASVRADADAVAVARDHDVEERVDLLAEALEDEEISLQEVRGYLVTRDALVDSYPTAWPTDGWVTSRYGWRRAPKPGATTFHTGIDIAAAYGSPITATADGTVVSARYREAYGYTVEIDHGYGIETLYAHCSRLLVEEGDEVRRGDVIARLGRTGRATGPHVHYEVIRDGVPVNPEPYLIEEQVIPTDE